MTKEQVLEILENHTIGECLDLIEAFNLAFSGSPSLKVYYNMPEKQDEPVKIIPLSCSVYVKSMMTREEAIRVLDAMARPKNQYLKEAGYINTAIDLGIRALSVVDPSLI